MSLKKTQLNPYIDSEFALPYRFKKVKGKLMIQTKLNPDGTIRLELGNESVSLTARELDQQIERLARARAGMPDAISVEPGSIDTVEVNPAYAVRTDAITKASLLRIRHSGFGWINYELPAREVLNMRQMWKDIVEKLGLDPVSDFYGGPERRLQKPH